MLVVVDGLVIIDTTGTTKAAKNIKNEFRKIIDKPVKTIIYTLSHKDHISAATVFAQGGNPQNIASDNFDSDLVDVDNKHPKPGKALTARNKRQFCLSLTWPDERISIGIGPGDRPMESMGAGYIAPTFQRC